MNISLYQRTTPLWVSALCFLFFWGGCADSTSVKGPEHTQHKKHKKHINSAQHSEIIERPNIVLIMVEDLSSRIGAYGDALAITPNIDALAEDGVLFERMFTAAPVCSPSRASAITGQYQQTLGAQHHRTVTFGDANPDGFKYLAVPPEHIKAFPELLRRGGYYTVNRSKADYQFGKPFTIWDEHGKKASWHGRQSGQPFFMMVSDSITHESRLFRYDSEPRNADEALIIKQLSKVLEGKPEPVKPDDVIVPPYLPDTLAVRQDIARQYNNVALMDANVGDLLADLKRDEVLGNTIVIWTTDHGDGLPRHKRFLNDSGLMVPFVVRFPDGKFAGTRRGDLASFIDLAPTILGLAGVTLPGEQRYPGRDLFDPLVSEPNYVFGALDRRDERPAKMRTARDRRYRLIWNGRTDLARFVPLEYSDLAASRADIWRLAADGQLSPDVGQYLQAPSPEFELYDTEKDPYEVNNLASSQTHQPQLNRMKQALMHWRQSLGVNEDRSELEIAMMSWPDGKQPSTASPSVCLQKDGGQKTLSVEVKDNASVGYRLSGGERTISSSWHLYTGPVTFSSDAQVEVRAIRYGHKESPRIIGVADDCERLN